MWNEKFGKSTKKRNPVHAPGSNYLESWLAVASRPKANL
jgi:hypothetical protein